MRIASGSFVLQQKILKSPKQKVISPLIVANREKQASL